MPKYLVDYSYTATHYGSVVVEADDEDLAKEKIMFQGITDPEETVDCDLFEFGNIQEWD